MTKNRNALRKIVFGFALVISFCVISSTVLLHTTAQAQSVLPSPSVSPTPAVSTSPTLGDADDITNDGTTCAIEKVGWFLCPIIEASGKIGDTAFQFLSTTFLATEPELISNSSSGTKQAWEIARNLANIMFIVAFIIIIYSQVTGAGITNYGIKKMLPPVCNIDAVSGLRGIAIP